MRIATHSLTVCALLFAGPAFAQNPAPIGWVAPPNLVDIRNSNLRADRVAVGDLTGDGRPDVAYVHRRGEGDRVYLLQNEMHGHAWPSALGDPLDDLLRTDAMAAIADMNDDGRPDLVVYDAAGAGRLTLWLAQADGSLVRELIALPEGSGAGTSIGLSIADADGDGTVDVAINDPAKTLLRRIAGEWQAEPLTLFPEAFIYPIRFADVDGDGDMDALGQTDSTPILLRNNGDPLPWGIQGAQWWRQSVDGPITLADVSPAGLGPEMIGSSADHLYIAPNALPGAIWSPWVQTPHLAMYEPMAVDFDGDGDQDLVGVMRVQPSNLLFLENDGAGGFRGQRRNNGQGNGNNYTGRVWPADLNGDGFDDATVSYNDGYLAFYAMGQGVLSATYSRMRDATVLGGTRRRHGTITVAPLVDLPDPVAVSEVTVRIDGGPAAEMIEAVEIVALIDGSPVVGRVEGAAIQAETRVPLAGDGLLVDNGAPVRLDVYFTVGQGAHRFAPTMRLAWDSVDATFTDGEPAPVVSQIFLANTWTLPNEPPEAMFDSFDVPEGGTALLDVLANDSDPEGDPLTIEIVVEPNQGVAEVVDGQIRYTHDGRESRSSDNIIYLAVDPRGAESGAGIASINILPVNDPTEPAPDAYVTREDVPLVVEADLGLLSNDTDVDSEVLSAVVDQPPPTGELQLAPDGGFIYLPAPDFNGEVRFTYRVDDGDDLSAPAEVVITVQPDDDAPVGADGPFETAQDTPVVLDLGGVDPEGAATVLLIEDFPERGYLVDLRPEAGLVTYIPRDGVAGEDRFRYRLTDLAVVSPIYEAVIQIAP